MKKPVIAFLLLIVVAAVAALILLVNPSSGSGGAPPYSAANSPALKAGSDEMADARVEADNHELAEAAAEAETQQPSLSRNGDAPVTQEAGVLIASGPAAGRRVRIPMPDEYIDQLPAPVQKSLNAFQQRYPDVDPTDTDSLHKTIMVERGKYAIDLSPDEFDAHHAWLAEMETMRDHMVQARGRLLGIPVNGIDHENRGYALVGFDGAMPLYSFTENREAAISTAASFVRRNTTFDSVFGPDIDGSGYFANVNDHGSIYWNTEFRNDSDSAWRLTEVRKNDSGSRDHMTHVAGTIGARGYNSRAMGMAPAVHKYILIQQSNSDVTGYGMNWPGRPERSIVGNTSLGGSTTGLYSWGSHSFDQVLYDTPYYLHFYSAGNSGSSYFTITGAQKISKNMMTVGAVNDVSRNSSGIRTGGGGIASWSSRGPANDGRIKPDIVANGVDLYSPSSTSNYGSMSGTSMASPNATGSSILLQDYFGKRFPGHYMRAASLKTLIINTAEDLGNPGPDYHYGWGLVNVLAGGRIIQNYASNPASRVLVEDTLAQGQTVSTPYTYNGSGPIRVTLGWHDIPGVAQTDSTVTTPALVNNLNLRLIAPNGSQHLPYVMPYVVGTTNTPPFDSSLRGAHAVRGVNFTDNTIQVLIAAPVAGEYTLEISHAGALTGGSQKYSLAVSGMTCALPTPVPVITSHTILGDKSDFFPFEVLGSGFLLGADVLLKRAGSEPVRAYAVEVVGNRLFVRFNTAAMTEGYWDVVVRNPDGTETVSDTPFLLPVIGGGTGAQTLYANSFTNGTGLTLEGGWAVGPPNQSAVGGPGSAQTGSNVLGTYLNGNYANNLQISATLPPVSTVNMENIKVNFHRWLGLAYNQTGGSSTRHADFARIQYSLNGSTWTSVWDSSSAFDDKNWSLQSHTLPASAQGQSAVHLRFVLETDAQNVSYGWNIDNLSITGDGNMLKLPPVFHSEPVRLAIASEAYSYPVNVSDGDTPASGLALAAVTLPSWLTLQFTGGGSTANLSGTPTAGDVGDHEVVLRVTDGDYVTWQIFTIRVYPEGHVPGTPIIVHLTPQELRSQSATLRANVLDGDMPLQVSLLWGSTDGGTNAAAWANIMPLGDKPLGEIAVPLADLSSGATYYYRFSATNDVATAWAPESGVLQLPLPPVVDAGPDQTVQSSVPVAWTPTNITTAAWYDGADASTITTVGGAVSQWNDKSGNGRHVSQSVADQQPSYSNNAVVFDGVDDLLKRNTAFIYANGSADVYIVGAFDGGNFDKRLFAESNSADNNPWYSIFQGRREIDATMTSAYIRDSSNTIRLSNASILSASGALDLSTRKLYQARDTGSSVVHRVGGGSTVSLSYTRGATTLDRFGLGGFPERPTLPTGGSFMRADLNELIVVPSLLSDSDRQKMEGYLAHKWGTATGLPADHPHKTTAPTMQGAATNLDGSASDPADAPLTIAWSLVSGPGGVNFADASDPKTTITFTELGTYVLRLTAHNGADTTHDDVTITVTDGTPVARAGEDQTVADNDNNGSESITLNGSGSSAPDGNTITGYVWRIGATQIATGPTPTVILPVGIHVITLTITDNNGKTASDIVTITVLRFNNAPIVHAGPDQTVVISEDVPEPWTPSALTTIAAWYDPSDAGTITSSGGTVSQLRDKSGNNRHLAQGSATAQPVTGSNTIGGLNAIDFDGSNDQLVNSSFSISTQNVSIFTVSRFLTKTTSRGAFNLRRNTESQGSITHYASSSTDLAMTHRYPTTTYMVYASPAADFLMSYVKNGTSDQKVWENGIAKGSSTNTETTFTSEQFVMGSRGSANYGHVRQGEIIMVASAISEADRQKVEGFLAHKWGLTAGLPSNHPYKSSAPTQGAVPTATATLAGSASDGDNDPLTTTWSVIGTPEGGSATIADASARITTATFTAVGEYVLRLTADDGMATRNDEVTITVSEGFSGADAFAAWALDGGQEITFTGDSNGDGVADGMSWLLGANHPSANANSLLPQAAETNGNLVLTFKMLNSSQRGTAMLRLEHSRDLGVTDPWAQNTITIPNASSTVGGVVFTITPIEDTDHNQVTATLPAAAANGTGKLFFRLNGVLVP